ncbi:type IV secretion system protein [Pseudovibrio sp. Tun.PSC04-5.I4]|uniref:type IV secretion system protein n=1 Tax=Pseudovibrio sp. Tun.PSC04-5.I4 TaxID=1798213 RepID=UPI00088F746B|nr:type IV secretion system protein [Pseudovibrio sp. Tun.PSC04-5.I4]SDR49044.1 TrbL/VirB6 plasmid conjugal transfer protein [Pseudovibrio sp. Tun.PSC04-5.I4]
MANDNNPACISCEIFVSYQDHADKVIDGFFDSFNGGMLGLFVAILVVWIVFQGIKMAIGTIDIQGAGQQFVYILVGFTFLQGLGEGLAQQVLDTSISIMSGLSIKIMSLGVDNINEDGGLIALIGAVEGVLRKVFSVAVAIIENANLPYIKELFYAAALVIPYALLLILFLAHITTALLRLTVLTLISPLIVLAASFPWGRDMAWSAVRVVLSAILTLFAVCTVFAIIISLISGLNVGDSNTTSTRASDVLSGPYMLAVVLGFMATALLSEITSMVGSIGGAMGGAGAAMMTGGAAKGASMGAGLAGRVGGAAASSVLKRTNSDMHQSGQNIKDKLNVVFKDKS